MDGQNVQQADRRMGLLIDPAGLNQQKYYEGKKQAAINSMEGLSKQCAMFGQQDSTTRNTDECPETGH